MRQEWAKDGKLMIGNKEVTGDFKVQGFSMGEFGCQTRAIKRFSDWRRAVLEGSFGRGSCRHRPSRAR